MVWVINLNLGRPVTAPVDRDLCQWNTTAIVVASFYWLRLIDQSNSQNNKKSDRRHCFRKNVKFATESLLSSKINLT